MIKGIKNEIRKIKTKQQQIINLPTWFIKRNKVGNWYDPSKNNKTLRSIIKVFKTKQILKAGTILYHSSTMKDLIFDTKISNAVFFGLDPYISIFYGVEMHSNKKNMKVYLHKLELKKDIIYTFINDKKDSKPFSIQHVYEGNKYGRECEIGKRVCVHPQIAIRYKHNNTKTKYVNSGLGDIYLEVTFPTKYIDEYLKVISTYKLDRNKVAKSFKKPETEINISKLLT